MIDPKEISDNELLLIEKYANKQLSYIKEELTKLKRYNLDYYIKSSSYQSSDCS